MTDLPGKALLIYGASSHGLVIAEAAQAEGWHVSGFIDDQPADICKLGQWSILTPDQVGAIEGVNLIVAIGDNMARRRIFSNCEDAGWNLINVIHPTAWVSPSAVIGRGVYIGPMAVVNAMARLDDGVIVNSGAIVEHHCHLHRFCHLCPSSAIAGHVTVGELTWVGTGACARPRVNIGQDCQIGAGAAVVSDIPDRSRAMGVPARSIALTM